MSLVPSATETLLALGADVAACTRFCKQPRIPAVGGTKNPDLDAIARLRPDAVVVDTEENRKVDAESLAAMGIDVVVTSVCSVADALAAVDQLADAAGVASRPTPAIGVVEGDPSPVFVPIWRRPWMTINAQTYGASLLATIGYRVVTADLPERYPTVELEQVADLQPAAVLVPDEPYDFTPEHVEELAAAFPAATVQRVDGEDLFWWGARTPAARDRLRRATAQPS